MDTEMSCLTNQKADLRLFPQLLQLISMRFSGEEEIITIMENGRLMPFLVIPSQPLHSQHEKQMPFYWLPRRCLYNCHYIQYSDQFGGL